MRVQTVITAVASEYEMSTDDLIGPSRARRCVEPRHVTAYLARKLGHRRLTHIARFLGGRDHSTIIHAIQSVEERMRRDESFAHRVQSLAARLQAGIITQQAR